jgi:outer membrane autotransporter protein
MMMYGSSASSGSGGIGVYVGNSASLINSGSISGGSGGSDMNYMSSSSGNGAGGSGVHLGNGSSLNNSGSISGGSSGYSMMMYGSSSASSGAGVYVPIGISASIINTGSIVGGANSGYMSIMSIGSNFYGVQNAGTISSLSNSQPGLTYAGILPTNYNIIINSPTNYGKLAVTGGAGTTAFGIFNGSTVANGTYTSVLSGISAGNLTATTGSYNSATWTLSNSSGSIWDLIISGVSTPSASAYRNALTTLRSHAAGAAGVLDSLTNNAQFAGVITALDALSGAAQANAIAQTLPAMAGAASQATTSSMQALNQVIQGRSSSLRGMSSGDEYIGNRDVWMKGFGSWANQHDVNGVSGYKVNTGGLAIGIDKGLTRKANIGAVFAFSNSGVSSNSSSAPSGVTVNSYQAGVYGDYAIHPQLIANAQVDIGMNQNNAYRNITFMGTNANSNYNSYSGHVGTGVKYLMPINAENTFIPSVRVDYTTVQSQAYTETGAGALNLSVGQQTYNTLIPSADLRIDHSLDSKLTLSANAGAGYNTLGNQVTSTAAYQGGGAVFATNGLAVSPWLYNAGVGITGQIEKNMQLNVRYDNVFSPTGYMNQMVSAKLKIPF